MKIERLDTMPTSTVYSEYQSPLGIFTIVASAEAVHGLFFENSYGQQQFKCYFPNIKKEDQPPMIHETKQQLTDYFQGKRRIFSLPIAMRGTEFQLSAWQQLAKIPYGETICYGQQAARLGDKNKARAVGMANGANPISIIIPCHRVIGSNGKLTGFGGGLDRKSFLLEHESNHL